MASIAGSLGGGSIGAYIGGVLGVFTFGIGTVASGAFIAAGSAIGSAAGGVIGAYIDQTYIYPLFSNPHHPDAARVQDLSITTALEGGGINFCLGAENRIGGQIIWMSDLIEVKVDGDQPSKGSNSSDPGSPDHYDYYYHVAVAVCEGVIEDIDKIWADSKVIYDSSVTPPLDPRVHLCRIYKGDEGAPQFADSLIESIVGAGRTPAFRGTAYFVLEALYLRDWGNRLPNFTIKLKAQTHESVAAGISNLLERGNVLFANGEYDVANVDHSIRGYTVTGVGSTISSVEPLTIAYDVLTQETNGQIVFFTRGREEIIDVDPTDLCAQESGDSEKPPRPFRMSDPSGFDLPREINVKYIDPTTEYQAGSQRFTRNDAVWTNLTQELNLPMVLAPKEAIDIAANRLWRAYAERQIIELSLPPSYLSLQENDILRVPWLDEIYTLRTTEVTVGFNHLIEVRGVLVGIESADEAVECNGRFNTPDELIIPPPATSSTLIVSILDTSAVRDSEVSRAGLYVAATVSDLQSSLGSASVYQSPNGLDTWTLLNSITLNSSMGVALTVLNPGPVDTVDMVNTVDVLMYEGELVSVSQAELYNGSNHMWVGEELIGYQTATLLSPKKYRLSNLIRGRRVTSTTHSYNERIVVLRENLVKFEPLSMSAIGSTRYIKFVQTGQTVDDVPTFVQSFSGNTLKQLPPCNFVVVRDSITADAVMSWTRRTRALVKAFSPQKPLLADIEQYTVEFYYNNTLMRTAIVTSPTYTYTGADQVADGMLFLSTFEVRVYQMNEQVGKGYYLEETVT